MNRTQSRKLIWNSVIYGTAFAAALLVAAFIRPAQELPGPIASASLGQPVAETTPAKSVAEAKIR
jgi:hypothetical protein